MLPSAKLQMSLCTESFEFLVTMNDQTLISQQIDGSTQKKTPYCEQQGALPMCRSCFNFDPLDFTTTRVSGCINAFQMCQGVKVGNFQIKCFNLGTDCSTRKDMCSCASDTSCGWCNATNTCGSVAVRGGAYCGNCAAGWTDIHTKGVCMPPAPGRGAADGLSAGAKAGVAFGVLGGVTLLAVAGYLGYRSCCRRKDDLIPVQRFHVIGSGPNPMHLTDEEEDDLYGLDRGFTIGDDDM